ncbi:MAG: hypothetical protein J6B10_07330 [Lachnospiraceae bacterium]|nr:hypothetical protein [Lachnospiraceae bacterium]
MTLKKSEKILLEILVLVAGFAAVLVFFFMPEAERRIELQSLSEELETELNEKQLLMLNQTLDESCAEARRQAEKNYDYFYSVLNGYSIDEIINRIAQEKNLAITTLNIGEYEDASADFTENVEGELSVLVKSTVNVTVLGSYDNILEFMDAVNEKSTCLRMNLISITENQNDATGEQGMLATFRIYLYGINVELEKG